MMRAPLLAMALSLCACEGERGVPSASAPVESPPRQPEPESRVPRGQAPRILVQRIAISFAGNVRGLKTLRPRDEAEKLAKSLLDRVRGGADFIRLRDEYSDDRVEGSATANGPYIFCNFGVEHRLRPDGVSELPRENLYRSVADVAFGLKPGEIGLAEYDAELCPHGWDVLLRLK